MSQEKRLVLDWTKAHDVVPLEKDLAQSLPQVLHAKRSLLEGSGVGGELTGWVHRSAEDDLQNLQAIAPHVASIQAHSNALVVIGIGGSLLGTKAIYTALTHSFASLNPDAFHKKPLLFWAGHHMAQEELAELLDVLEGFLPSLVVVSKSGTTTEPALAFRVLQHYLEERFGVAEARHRIFFITDPVRGALRHMAEEFGYPTLTLPPSIGGRYSVFTAVGLLPLAVSGVDVKSLLGGAWQAYQDVAHENNHSFETNPALCYAALRNVLYKSGYKVESLATWNPKLTFVAEWWKQLFAEGDGKNNTGLLPTSVTFSTDLHSMGQYFQDGERCLFATHLRVLDEYSLARGSQKRQIRIPTLENHPDGLEYMEGETLARAQTEAQLGTCLAHSDGKLPTLVWELPEMSAWWLGYWMYLNLFACAVGGYARGINPFNQPGVESYKRNMLALMGQPELQAEAQGIRNRLLAGARLRSLGMTTRG